MMYTHIHIGPLGHVHLTWGTLDHATDHQILSALVSFTLGVLSHTFRGDLAMRPIMCSPCAEAPEDDTCIDDPGAPSIEL
jgi:hypothetical protein